MALSFICSGNRYYLKGNVEYSQIHYDDLDYVSVEPEVTLTGYDSSGNYTGEGYYTLSNPSMLLPGFAGIYEDVTNEVTNLLQGYSETASVQAHVYINGMGGSYYTIDCGTITIREGDDPSAYPEGFLSLADQSGSILLTGDVTFGSDWSPEECMLYKNGNVITDEGSEILISDPHNVNCDLTSQIQSFGDGEYHVVWTFYRDIDGMSTTLESNRFTYSTATDPDYVAPTCDLRVEESNGTYSYMHMVKPFATNEEGEVFEQFIGKLAKSDIKKGSRGETLSTLQLVTLSNELNKFIKKDKID